jgi:hypothetical protein
MRKLSLAVAVLVIWGCNCDDSGGPDGGSSDAGPADAGAHDAGRPDSGAIDSGTPFDAGQLPPCNVGLNDTVDATLYLSIDDEGTLYLNGTAIATQQVPWNNPLVRTLQVNRNPTVPNVVAIEARNVYAQAGVDRAALVDFRLGVQGAPDASQIFASGEGWKTTLAADSGISDGGWTAVDFDDSTWGPSVSVLPYGASPYGNIFAQFGVDTSGAWWMWAYDPSQFPNRPTIEPIWFRRVFYFSVDGGFSADAGACIN